jgi:hypothetical protein
VAQNNSVSLPCAYSSIVNLTSNDSDPDGHYPLSLTNITQTSSGFASANIVLASSVSVYSGTTGGTTYFTYTVADTSGATDTAQLTVNTTCGPGGL